MHVPLFRLCSTQGGHVRVAVQDDLVDMVEQINRVLAVLRRRTSVRPRAHVIFPSTRGV